MGSRSSHSIDSAAIDELLTRGVAEVYPSRDALRHALTAGKRLRVYNGIDPTGATLHIGHLASLLVLRRFQELGHEVMMLVGDFTGMIGDPTGKSTTRKQLSRAQVRANAARYREQAASVLRFTGRNAARVRRNAEWWDRMPARRFLELLSVTTTQRLLERDMFQERIREGAPVGAHELLYPALQGYDSVAMHVDVEVGGTDQTFNMLMGREYVRKLEGREKFVVTVPLIADATGKKIGKSEGNMVELGAAPNDLFGQAMALPDGVIFACFEQATAVPLAAIESLRGRLAAGVNPRDCKMELAHEFVRMRYDADAADGARAAFVKTFQEHEAPEEVSVRRIPGDRHQLVDLLVAVGFVGSKSEARRLVVQWGVRIDGAVAADANTEVKLPAKGVLLQKGKRHFVRVLPSASPRR